MGTQSTAPTDKVNTVCRAVLESVAGDVVPWLNTLISCYVKTEDISTGNFTFELIV